MPRTLKTFALGCAVVALLLLSLRVKAQSRPVPGKIHGQVNISFRTEELSAQIAYDYVAGEDHEDTITFYLNEAFDVKKADCRLCQSFYFDRKAERGSLIIKLKRPLAKSQRLTINIDYAGSLTHTLYKPDQNYLELGLDNFWYPVHQNTSEFRFTYRLSIKTDKPDYQLVSNGRNMKTGAGWLVTSKVPDFDIDLIFAAGLKVKTLNDGTYNLQIVSKDMPDEASATLLAAMKDALDFYNSTFGAFDRQREVTGVFRPFLEPQFGYFRKGYFVLPQVKNVHDIVFPISHELSHYWWLNAGQQNAWLNESFAEYSAMMFLRRQQGVDAFRKLLEEKRKASANLPPVYGFDRTKNRQAAPGVMYRKGVIKLSELEDELGEQKFMDFLRAAAKAKVRDTDALIEILAQASSREVADKFLQHLKE